MQNIFGHVTLPLAARHRPAEAVRMERLQLVCKAGVIHQRVSGRTVCVHEWRGAGPHMTGPCIASTRHAMLRFGHADSVANIAAPMTKHEATETLVIEGRQVRISHPDKLYFSQQAKLSKL